MRPGDRVTWYPSAQAPTDNLHFAAVVEAIQRRGRVRIKLFREAAPDGELRTVSARHLVLQRELLPLE